MEESRQNFSLGYFKFGKGNVTEEGTRKGFSYKTSTSLIENIIAKKERIQKKTDGKTAITEAKQEYTDKKGKRVNLSPFQMKLVTAFAQVIDTLLDNEGSKEYIKSLPCRIEDRNNEDGKTKKLPNSIKCEINIPELTKLMYSTNRVGGKQSDKVREEIVKLSEISQTYKFKDSRGGTLTIEAPLISLGKKIKYETKDGVVKLNKVEITFEDVFVYEINDKYSLSPVTLLQLWNNTGVQTELFTMLLFLLQNIRGNFVSHSQQIVAERRKELKKAKVEAKEMEEELAKLRKSTLTYKEGITSLLERIDRKKYHTGKYLNMPKLSKDLQQAEEALLQIGIISEYYETLGSSGDKVCNFVINEKWLIDEANRIKQLLPPKQKKE